MSAPTHLHRAARAMCDDAALVVSATSRFEVGELSAVARRRDTPTAAALKQANEADEPVDARLPSLFAALAPVFPAPLLPLSEAIHDGLHLEPKARGLRSLFTSKPSEKEIARVRQLGELAVKALLAVKAASSGGPPDEARLLVALTLAAMGYQAEERDQLLHAPPTSPEDLAITGDTDRSFSRRLVEGCCLLAASDGIDPGEHDAIRAIGRKAGLPTDEVESLRAAALAVTDQARATGTMLVDAARWMLGGSPRSEADPLSRAIAQVALPSLHRGPALQAIDVAQAVTLAGRYLPGRRERRAALALGWLVVLRRDPRVTERALAVVRHDALATDLGSLDDGLSVRQTIDEWLERELGALAQAYPPEQS